MVFAIFSGFSRGISRRNPVYPERLQLSCIQMSISLLANFIRA